MNLRDATSLLTILASGVLSGDSLTRKTSLGFECPAGFDV